MIALRLPEKRQLQILCLGCHSDDIETELMFAGHNAYRFASDPFYANGYIPTVRELVHRIVTGD